MNTNTSMERFRELAAEVAPLQNEADKIKAEMVKIAHKMNIEIVTAAFPNAATIDYRAVAEIRPTDLAKAATETVQTIQTAISDGTCTEPDTIIIDHARMTVTIGYAVPPAGRKKAVDD